MLGKYRPPPEAHPVVEFLEPRRLLAAISWAQPVNGSFDDPSKWSSGTVPGPADDVSFNAVGNYKVSVTSDVSLNSLTIGADANNGPSIEVDSAALTANAVSVRGVAVLILRNSTLTAPQGVQVTDQIGQIDMDGGSTIHANVDLNGGLVVALASNTIDGQITTHPGSGITVVPVSGPADLTVGSGFTVNGSLALNSTVGAMATLTIADGTAITLQKGPPIDGVDQGTLQGGGQINGALINNGAVTPDMLGVPLTINGRYVQSPAATLTVYVGRAADGSSPSLLQVNGAATLDGMLEMDALGVIGTNKLPNGRTDTLMTYSSESGTFSGTRGLNLRPSIGSTSVTVTAGHRGTGHNFPPDLTVAVKPTPGKHIVSGSKGSASVAIVNIGAGPASGTITITLHASTDQQLDAGDSTLSTPLNVGVHLKPLGIKVVKVPFRYPTLAPGDYYIIASITPSSNIADTDPTNNIRASKSVIHISQ